MIEPRLTITAAASQPLNCLITLKVGSTFLRNLVYVLDHGEPYTEIERDFPRELHSRTLTRAQLAEQVSFFVVRDPIERFFSLYFDKAIGGADSRFPWVVDVLKKNRVFHDAPDLTIDQHRENCMSLLGYVSVRLRGKDKQPVNPHWNKQIKSVERGIRFGLPALMLEDLDAQILRIADGRIEGLEETIAKVQTRNRSARPIEAEDIITPEIYAKISKLYAEDIQLYDLVKTSWELNGKPPEIEL